MLADTVAKIEELQNLAKVDSSMFSLLRRPSGIDTAAGGRSRAKRCAPSRRRVQNTRALKIAMVSQNRLFQHYRGTSGPRPDGTEGPLLARSCRS